MKVKDHYDKHLARVYSWMSGDFEHAKRAFRNYCFALRLPLSSNPLAIDLGAGHGIQAFALADLGYRVIAVDFNRHLLDELSTRVQDERIEPVYDDIRNVLRFHDLEPSLMSCCGDTITHLSSHEEIEGLIRNCRKVLSKSGHLILSFRDYSEAPPENTTIIPVKSDENKILTCLLDYEKDRVKVTDLLFIKDEGKWEQKLSWYYKIRISKEWIISILQKDKFAVISSTNEKGMIHILSKNQR